MTDEEAIAKQVALEAFAALQENAAWKTEIVPWIEEQHRAALDAVTRMHDTPAKRAESIEAYHLTKALLCIVPNRIDLLRRQLVEFQKQAKNRPLL